MYNAEFDAEAYEEKVGYEFFSRSIFGCLCSFYTFHSMTLHYTATNKSDKFYYLKDHL